MRSACIAIWCVCVCVLPCVQALVVPEGGIAHRSRSSPLRPAASTLHATSKVCSRGLSLYVRCMHMLVYTHAHNTWQRMAMAMGSTTVDIVQLLGCCVCACERAATVIRAVESKRRSATTGSIEGAVLKVATDSRSYLTEADTAAQKIIMQTLRGEVFPLDT